jgi:hypothetical protein
MSRSAFLAALESEHRDDWTRAIIWLEIVALLYALPEGKYVRNLANAASDLAALESAWSILDFDSGNLRDACSGASYRLILAARAYHSAATANARFSTANAQQATVDRAMNRYLRAVEAFADDRVSAGIE